MFSAVLPLAAYALSCATGYFLLHMMLADREEERWLLLFLSPGAGLGITAILLFLEIFLSGKLFFLPSALVHFLILGFLIAAFLKKKPLSAGKPKDLFIFSSVCGLAALLTVFVILKSPYGTGLDVWAIWKLKARYLFESPSFWRSYFVPELGFSHQDYPLFYPLAIVWGWMAAGRENTFSCWMLAALFTVSTAGLLMAAAPRGLLRAFAGLALISVPVFIGMGGSQYADILMAYFALAGAVLICRAFEKDLGVYFSVSGIFLGLGALVKNEGIVILAAGFISIFLCRAKTRNLLLYITGALPGFLCALLLKHQARCPNEVFSVQNIRHFLSAPGEWLHRSVVIMTHISSEVFRESSWVYGWLLLLFYLLLFPGRAIAARNRFCVLLFFLCAAGYFGAYLITPLELNFHLNTSLDRLMVQLFPLALLTVFRGLEA